MNSRGFSVSGFSALDRQFAKLERGFGSNSLRQALFVAGTVIADEAKRLVPVRSGNLRDSIIVSFDKMNFSRIEGTAPGLTVYVGPEQGRTARNDGFYGHMIEFGTVHSAAHPFMRPALDSKHGVAQAIIRTALLDDIKGAIR